ncbi:hypothetical protein [Yersinia enterocolitica]|uniref:hypothetical protein n=1 Tax=Yersinia enterocolitica TaxID=630 RepID=UPI00313EF9AF
MSRNGTDNSNNSGFTLYQILAPYGMRKINGYGDNVWEFYNKSHDVIGLPFQLANKPTPRRLEAVSYDNTAGDKIYFYSGSPDFPGYWERLEKVFKWKLKNGPLEITVQSQPVPHSYSIMADKDDSKI